MENTRQSDATRHRILEASFEEIHRNGYQAASISNILTDTKLTKGALYHYFPSKKALGLAVVDEVIRAFLLKRIIQPLLEAERPVHALIELLRNKEAQSGKYIRLGCPLNNLMQEMSPVDEDFRNHLNQILNEWRETIEEALRRAQHVGDVRNDVDCPAAALFIVSAWEGCVGIAKNMQSVTGYWSCMAQLRGYVEGLLKPGETPK
jgi:AcrR family transcriptional regulator